ncbi:hypothetical protein MPER_15877, partial [Moniliophthora perniciosa FA553]
VDNRIIKMRTVQSEDWAPHIFVKHLDTFVIYPSIDTTQKDLHKRVCATLRMR